MLVISHGAGTVSRVLFNEKLLSYLLEVLTYTVNKVGMSVCFIKKTLMLKYPRLLVRI